MDDKLNLLLDVIIIVLLAATIVYAVILNSRLAQLRATLRGRMEASPLMDGKQFAADIESAYCDIWEQWCAQNGPIAST